MKDSYYLNLNGQPDDIYEVHKESCYLRPDVSFEHLGDFMLCSSAMDEAKKRYPEKNINGCKECSSFCHSS